MGVLNRVRLATMADLDFVSQDAHPPRPDVIERKIAFREIFIVERNGDRVGYARIEYLWSYIPCLSAIWILEPYRRQGAGKAILSFIEKILHDDNHEWLYSSTHINEKPPQNWHRHMGFEECGFIAAVNEDGMGEMFFRKHLTQS